MFGNSAFTFNFGIETLNIYLIKVTFIAFSAKIPSDFEARDVLFVEEIDMSIHSTYYSSASKNSHLSDISTNMR